VGDRSLPQGFIAQYGSVKGEREKGSGIGDWALGIGHWALVILPLSPSFKGRVFKISKIVEKILKCFTWFGCFRIFKSAEMVKKLPNTKSLPLKVRYLLVVTRQKYIVICVNFNLMT
jgi:hypothetical protein